MVIETDRPGVAPQGRGTARILAAGAVDQAFSGLSNLMIAFAGAALLSAEDFGYFSVCFVVLTLAVLGTRSVVGEPALVWSPDRVPGGQVLPTLVISGCAAVVCLTAAALAGPALARPMVVVAVMIPGVALQDVGRYVSFGTSQITRATVSDLLWVGANTVGLGIVVATDTASPSVILAVWGLSGFIAGLAVFARSGWLRPSQGLAWLRVDPATTKAFALTFVSTAGVAWGSILLLGLIDGTESVGAVRGMQQLFSPVTLLAAAAVNTAVVSLRERQVDGPRILRGSIPIGLGLAAAALATAAVIALLPTSVGETVIGDTWHASIPLLAPAVIHMAAIGIWTALRIALLAMRHVDRAARLDLVLSPFLLGLPLVGAAMAGVEGYYWGLAMIHVVALVPWWRAGHEFAHGAVSEKPPAETRP